MTIGTWNTNEGRVDLALLIFTKSIISANNKAPHLSGFVLRDFIASFRNLCFDPPAEMRQIFNELEQLRLLLLAG